MPTRICNIVAVNIGPVNSGTALASRTYTATRRLLLADLKGHLGANPGDAVTFTVSTPTGTCITKVTGNAVADRDVVRLGDNANDRRDDDNARVVAGQSIVFASNSVADTLLTLYCWTLD